MEKPVGRLTRLAEWRRSRGLTLEAMGRLIGADGESVRRYERGERLPDRARMARIWLMTGGEVAPNDFYDLPPLPDAAPAPPPREAA